MNIECYDEHNRIIIKKIEIINRDNRIILSLGGSAEWEFDMLKKSPAVYNKICIDAMGRNHFGSPVYCDFEKLMTKADLLWQDTEV